MRSLISILITVLLSTSLVIAQPSTDVKTPQIERLDEARIKLGEITIDRKIQEVVLPAKINLTQGILEYYAVASGGKLHEAILEILVEPSHLHLALILAGYESSEYGPQDPKTYQRPLLKQGSLLRIYVRWTTQQAQQQWLPASVWLYDRSIEQAPQPLTYIFQGSRVYQGKYIADLDRSVIGLIPDETVVLAATLDKGNPYRGDANGYEAHSSVIPPKGTKIELVIRPASPQDKEEVEAYVKMLKKLKEEDLNQQLKDPNALPHVPSFSIQFPSAPSSSQSYQDRP